MTDEPAIIDAIQFLRRPFGLADAEKLIVGDDDGRDCFWGAWHRGGPALIDGECQSGCRAGLVTTCAYPGVVSV